MPIVADYSLNRDENGTLTVEMIPPTPIGQWSIEFRLTKRFGSNDYIILGSVASGYNNVSGINIVNSGAGIMNIPNYPAYMSGREPGPYAYTVIRTDAGLETELSTGYRLMNF